MNPNITIIPNESPVTTQPHKIMLGGNKLGELKTFPSSYGPQWQAIIDIIGPGVPSCTMAHGFAETHEDAIKDAFRRTYAETIATLKALTLLAAEFDVKLDYGHPRLDDPEPEQGNHNRKGAIMEISK